MREGEPSRTAFGAAAYRAIHQDADDGRVFRDPLAWQILGGDKDAVLAEAAGQDRPRLRLFIAVRHRFAEDSLAAAVARGTQQVVVLGAGLDTFAYRNPFPETTVFEVDHPATGAWKQEQLASAGIVAPSNVTYVGVDFETDDLMTRLVGAGFDPSAPAFFVWLGVVPYLSRDAVTATLGAIASVPGGEVVFDYTNPVDQLRAVAQDDRADLIARVAEVGEPLSAGLDTADLLALLTSLGFSDIDDLDRPDIRSRYLGLPPGDAGGGAHIVRARVVDGG
ncbi:MULTISPECIES: class I SAM-dependent methyltransferase [unclassified Nocardioides]|uniref:class I SAM-dependent methyltransferase n=1 Tax=unclassified Nocardioides TaxID=2615069 RepID=UPI0009EF9ED5|nr:MULTISPECIES: SAM-dependent methyltransferase [unclassified Nocardioides]GAW52298.1 Mlr0915 protein [Nocardioides sp. PD653-B2]GAW56017.1 Mlr0915 protein [Nocardioides sp. PD653]